MGEIFPTTNPTSIVMDSRLRQLVGTVVRIVPTEIVPTAGAIAAAVVDRAEAAEEAVVVGVVRAAVVDGVGTAGPGTRKTQLRICTDSDGLH